jgi:DNA-binding PadR family transcriptional regulator
MPMPKNPDDAIGALGRFSEPALHVLIALAAGPRHGYAIMLEIETLTGRRPGPGTLYGAIARIEQRGWIEPIACEDRRQPYRLTGAGRRVLVARLDAMRALTRAARARLAIA